MNRQVLWVVAVPLVLGGLTSCERPSTGGEIERDAAAAPSDAGHSAGPQPGLAAEEPRLEQVEVLRFSLIALGPLTGLPFRIDAVQSNGSAQIRLDLSDEAAAEMARAGFSPALAIGLIEGHYLGLSGLPRDPSFFFRPLGDFPRLDEAKAIRVQMTEVHEGVKATVRLGHEAAKQLKQGDTLFLVRPAGSTTAQLQAVPDVIGVIDARGEVLGMDARTAALMAQSENNLKQIGLAMHNFHDTFKCFPPAVVYGPDGKPWHSWRVLILPFVEQSPLYQRYRFDEPWDGPNNKMLIENVPPVYRDPIYGESKDAYTHYALATGPGTGFPPETEKNPPMAGDMLFRSGSSSRRTRIREFRDGTSNTVLAGSISPERKIPWTKPEDVTFDENFPALGKEGSFAAPYKTEKGSGGVFLFCDASVKAIREDIDLQMWRNLFQIADGHPIGEIPTLRPTVDYRRRQIPVLEIPRDKPGASARLVFEAFTPEEERLGAPARPPQPSSPQAQTTNNLKQLVLALHNYHDVYKSFPAGYSTDQQGKPLLSWRVRVLPFVEEKPLYEQFHLDEPWDSEHNKQLVAKMPAVFRSPASKAEPGKTNYLGVGGPKGIFSGKNSVRFADITDGASLTIAIVEANDQSAVIWTKPEDFVPDPENPRKGLLGLWPGGFHAAFADGSVRFLTDQTDAGMLQASFTRNGAELVGLPREPGQGPVPPMALPVPVEVEAQPAPPPPTVVRPVSPAPPVATPEQAVAEIEKLGGKLLVKGFKSSWSPDGKHLVFGKTPPGSGISVIEVETGKVKDLVPAGKDPAWSPGEGRWIAYVRGDGLTEEVWVIPVEGGGPRRLVQGGFPNWAPDAKSLFIQSHSAGKLWEISLDAQDATPKDLLSVAWWYPAVSPDGKRVAYRAGQQVVVVDRESNRTLKTWAMPGNGRGWLGGWSADGRQLGFGGYGGGDNVACCIVDVETGNALRLPTSQATMPAWSPDGSKVALDLRLPGGWEVWTIPTEALKTLPPVDLARDRYAVPEGGIEELLKFIQDLRNFHPGTAQEYSEHRQKAPEALKAVAQQILRLEKDQWSEAYQTALRVLLGDRVRTIRSASPSEQRQAFEFVKTFLTAKLEKRIESQDAGLAMSAATALEQTDNHQLAAEAYQSFAELIGKSEDEALLKTARMMEGAARRLMLLDKEMELEGTTMDGSSFDWAAYRGKVVLVDFWTTWCPYCWPEIANAKKNYRLYHDRGFDVVGINLEEDTEKVKEYVEKESLPWTILHTKGAGWSHPMAAYYGVRSVPTMMLVGREGKVVSLRPRGSELDKLLAELIGPPYAPKGKLTYVDLQPKANRKLNEPTLDGREGNDLKELPKGEQTFGGVRFNVGDGLIQLAGTKLVGRPPAVEGIAVNRRFHQLYILHGTQYGTGGDSVKDGTTIGHYLLHYEDGTTEAVPIVYGEDVRNWWNDDGSRPVARGTIAWVGSSAAVTGPMIRLYLTAWENPHSDKTATAVDYVSTNTTPAAPFCVAVTVEEATETPIDGAAADSPSQ